DVDGDKTMDVVATNGNSIRVLSGDGRGGFRQSASIPVGSGAWRITAADVNADGAIDLVTGNSESNSLSVLLAKSPR
ncbi:MAG TPA: VCBS repeat-containing protein, partial [Pyrinomonadaceae bacterium]|nr:VCBS repeat-containing protein [Pyrinomonadaceae bacterium]